MRRSLLLFVVVLARVSLAQEPVPPAPESAPPMVRAPAEPEPEPPASSPGSGAPLEFTRGALLRVQPREGRSQSGELLSLTPRALSLQISPEQVVEFALADVEQLEVRERHVKAGALIGAGVAGVGGGIFFSLLCSFAVSETDDSAVPCVALGTLLSVVTGVGAGALMGMAVPRWSPVHTEGGQKMPPLHLRESDEDVLAHWFSGDLPVGEAGLQLGYAREVGLPQPTAGFGGQLHVLVLFGPYFALGPEVAWYQGVGSEVTVFNGQVTRTDRNHFRVGGLLRVGAEVGPVRAAVMGGLGTYSIGRDFLGASVGGEVEVRLSQRLPPLAAEVRYHLEAEENALGEPASKILTIGLGPRLRW